VLPVSLGNNHAGASTERASAAVNPYPASALSMRCMGTVTIWYVTLSFRRAGQPSATCGSVKASPTRPGHGVSVAAIVPVPVAEALVL